MDTTKGYILMCDKARKIQEALPKGYDNPNGGCLSLGDWVSNKHYTDGTYYTPFIVDTELERTYITAKQGLDSPIFWVSAGYAVESYKDFIWLPLQHQLQDMVKYDIQAELISAFFKFAFMDSWCGKLGSMEQLWLAFVMKEKHQATWNGADWTITT